jgi:hypothetical protein
MGSATATSLEDSKIVMALLAPQLLLYGLYQALYANRSGSRNCL